MTNFRETIQLTEKERNAARMALVMSDPVDQMDMEGNADSLVFLLMPQNNPIYKTRRF